MLLFILDETITEMEVRVFGSSLPQMYSLGVPLTYFGGSCTQSEMRRCCLPPPFLSPPWYPFLCPLPSPLFLPPSSLLSPFHRHYLPSSFLYSFLLPAPLLSPFPSFLLPFTSDFIHSSPLYSFVSLSFSPFFLLSSSFLSPPSFLSTLLSTLYFLPSSPLHPSLLLSYFFFFTNI